MTDKAGRKQEMLLFLRDGRGWRLALFFSLLFVLALRFGARLDSVEHVDVGDLRLWVSIPLPVFALAFFVRLFWLGMERLSRRCGTGTDSARQGTGADSVQRDAGGTSVWRGAGADSMRQGAGGASTRLEKRQESQAGSKLQNITHVIMAKDGLAFMGAFFSLLLCWLPVFLAVYPGFFVYDAQDEYVQVATRAFSTHHPLLHVLLLGGMICGVHKLTGSYNLGIACYVIFQMLLAAAVFAFLLSYLQKKGASRAFRRGSLLYLGLFPTVVMFTLCSAKDALFALALVLLLLCLLELGTAEAVFYGTSAWRLLFVASAAAMMLFRNNGLYAFLLLLPLLVFLQKRNRLRILSLCLCALGIFFLINGSLKAALRADDSERQEILTVPIQQLARAYRYAPEVFSEQDLAALHEILPEKSLALYTPRLSDPVKAGFDNAAFAKDKAKYAALWLRIGLKKPLIYFNAWCLTSYGFWYPPMVINVYGGHTVFTFTYKDSSYFGYEVEEPGHRESKIPWLAEVYRKLSLEVWKENIPVLSWLFSPGGMFWLYALLFVGLLNNKRYEILYPFLPVFLLWLTTLLGPTYLPRYVLFFWYGLPLFACAGLFGFPGRQAR